MRNFIKRFVMVGMLVVFVLPSGAWAQPAVFTNTNGTVATPGNANANPTTVNAASGGSAAATGGALTGVGNTLTKLGQYTINPADAVVDATKAAYNYAGDQVKSAVSNTVGYWIAYVANLVLRGCSWVLYQAAIAFNWSINYSLSIVKIMTDLPIVTIGWKILLNITNLAYIFILLFVAICMILGLSEYGNKALIARIILTAVFVNFSLFGTKLVIDVTNITALQFYNLINPADKSTDGPTDLSGQFVKPLGLTTIFADAGKLANGGDTGNDLLSTTNGPAAPYWRIALVAFLGSIFVLITAVVFLAGAFLFITRTLMLLFLMMFSSIAFAANVLPKTKKHFTDWSNMLIKNALFAPIFIGLLYILVTALQTSNLGANINFANMILNGEYKSGLISFFMVLGALIGIILISARSGVMGGKWAADVVDKRFGLEAVKGYGKSIGNAALNAGKNTGKYFGNMAADTNLVRKAAGYVPRVFGGGALRSGLASSAKANQDRIKKNASARQKEYEYVAKFKTDPNKSPEENKAAETAARLHAQKQVLGVDEKYKDVNAAWWNPAVWSRTERFIGGQGAKDAINAVKKKMKKEQNDKKILDAEIKGSAKGIMESTGIKVIDKDGNVDDAKMLELYEAYQDNKVKFYPSTKEVVVGETPYHHNHPLSLLYNEASNPNPDISNAKKQEINDIKRRLKTYVDAKKRESDREDRAERDGKKDKESSKDKPKP